MERKLARLSRALERAFGSPRKARGDLLDSLVGTVLSQSTNSANSSRAFASLKDRFCDWSAALRAGAGAVERAIRSGGLSKQKSRNIVAILRRLRAERGELTLEFLRSLDDRQAYGYLVSLPGVGPKTAACVMLFAMGRDVFPVDTHVHRTLARLGVSRGRTPEETFRLVSPHIPRGKAEPLHLNLVRLGREYCRSSSPRCRTCPARRLCPSAGRAAPAAKKRGLAAVAAAVVLAGCTSSPPFYVESSGENERSRWLCIAGVTTVASREVKEEGEWKKDSRSVSIGGPLFEYGVYEGGNYKEISFAKPIFTAGWGELQGLRTKRVSVFPFASFEHESEPSGTGGVLSRKRVLVPIVLLGVLQDNYGPGFLQVDFPWPFGQYTKGSPRGHGEWQCTHRLLPFYSYARARHGGKETVKAKTLGGILTYYRRDSEADAVSFWLLGGLYGYRRERREREYRLFWLFRWKRS